jgi:hypothetical protein
MARGLRSLAAQLLLFGAVVCVPACSADAGADADGEDEPSDDPVSVADAELRAGGIEQVVVRVTENDLANIVVRVERLEARGYAAGVVETFAIARTLDAAQRTPASALAEEADYLWDHVKLNEQERALCRSKKLACIKTLYVAHRAKSRSRDLYADGENGGRRDAFRHSYWNARMVRAAGATWAKSFADAHENGYPENRATPDGRVLSEMDFFNNDVGRTHGARESSDDALVASLQGAIARGELKAVRFAANGGAAELVGTDTCAPAQPCGR